MTTSDIGLAFVEFTAKTGGKKRPVLIVGRINDDYLAFSITSKFESKSPQIKAVYYEIQNWQAAGLDLPSWIDTGHILYLSQTQRIQKIGTLPNIDREKLTQFLRKRNAL